MAKESGYITPEMDTDSGSEYCPSDRAPLKKQPKNGKKGKSQKATPQKAPSPPLTAPTSADQLEHQKHPVNEKPPAEDVQFPFDIGQIHTFSFNQPMQPNVFHQQDFLNPHNVLPSLPPSAFQNLQGNNVGGVGMGYQLGKMPMQFPAFWQRNTENPAAFKSKIKPEVEAPMDLPGNVWADDIWTDDVWADAAKGGYNPQLDPELKAFAREIAALEVDCEMQLGGGGPLTTFAPAGAAAPAVKLEPAMDNSFAPSIDRESTATSQRSDCKPRGRSNTNASPSTIPLVCTLCDKRPTFSDVSHLLTHISSKGHLSRRFNLDIKGQTDPGVEVQLRQYDHWFEQNGINELLKTRQEAKEHKKDQISKRQRGTVKDKTSRQSSVAHETFKIEPEGTPHMPHSHLNPLNLQNWTPDLSYGDAYQTPSNKRTRSEYPEPDSPHRPATRKEEDPLETGKQGGSRTPTLKGVTYAGMGIFDAGTPEMKRMRNQRKDPSVVKNMMSVSESIAKTEFVWDSEMKGIERTRSVYDTPTEPSDEIVPDEDDAPPPAKKPRAPRAAPKSKPKSKSKAKSKSEESPEPSGPANQRLTRSAARAMNQASTLAIQGGKRGNGKRGHKALKFDQDLKSDEDWQSDEDMGISQRRRGLDVFQDDAPGNGSLRGSMLTGRHQGVQGYDGNPFGGRQSAVPLRSALHGLPPNRPLSSMYGRSDSQQFSLVDKENDRNAFSLQQNPNTNLQLGYYQPRQNMQSASGYNPLCLQRTDSFNQVYGTSFDTTKQSDSTFQNMNGLGYTNIHGGMNGGLNTGLNNDLGNGLANGLANGLTNGLTNTMANAMANGMTSGLHSGISNNMSHGLNNGTNNNGSAYQPGHNSGQSNGFDMR